jgi:MYXO-CTERM domain-containing protein
MKTRRNFDSKINSITNGRWTGYMAAAAASGFAAAHPAEATIHYSGLINQKITGNHIFRFPLDPAGGSFEAIHNNYVAGSSSFSAGGGAKLYFHGARSAAINGVICTCTDHTQAQVCASRLNRRDVISTRPFAQGLAFLAYDYYGVPGFWFSCGNFQDRGVSFAGFKFNNGAGDQYGWVRVKMLDGRRNFFKVVDYAYGDPGERVFAGQTGANTSAPELESLAGLALGAVGLLAWRRRRETLVQ